MIGAEAGDLAFEELAVGRVGLGDLGAIDDEDAALAIFIFLQTEKALHAGEEGVLRPGGADEEAGGVVGGGHGSEALVVDRGKDVLSLVEDEEGPGGGADDVGVRLGREEDGVRIAEAEDGARAALPFALQGEVEERRDSRRRMERSDWGSMVGAAATREISRWAKTVMRYWYMAARVSSLPPWRANFQTKDLPRSLKMESRTASAASTW